MRRRVFSAFLGAGLIGLALSMSSAQAGTILVFGQNGTSNTFSATNNGNTGMNGGTTLSAVNVAVTITAIDALIGTPVTAYFNLSASSVNDATTSGGHILQDFSGSFSLWSKPGMTGIDYLSGTFVGGTGTGSGATVEGANNSLTFSASSPDGVPPFSSDVISGLYVPRAISLAFTNVTPSASITGNNTLAAFGSNVSGNFSATPEPASWALLGIAMTGVFAYRRLRLSKRSRVA